MRLVVFCIDLLRLLAGFIRVQGHFINSVHCTLLKHRRKEHSKNPCFFLWQKGGAKGIGSYEEASLVRRAFFPWERWRDEAKDVALCKNQNLDSNYSCRRFNLPSARSVDFFLLSFTV